MASMCGRARQALQSNSTRNAVVSKLFGSKSSSIGPNPTKLPGSFTKPNLSPHRLFSSSRLPVELGGALSLMPLHSANASALFTSLLSLQAQSSLLEGVATPP